MPWLMSHPRRNDRISYIGRSSYLVTAVTRDRVKAFEDIEFGRMAQDALLKHASEREFAIPAYVLMPDHVHSVATGLSLESDLRRLITNWKQATGYAWSQLGRGRLWQGGYWERLARFDEPIIDMVRYVVYNPVRAKLVADPTLYPLIGSTERTIEDICEELDRMGRH